MKYSFLILSIVLCFSYGCNGMVETWRTKNNYVPTGTDQQVSTFPVCYLRGWYRPNKISSIDEAIANIKNLQTSILFEGVNAVDVDVDKYGMRAKIEWDETVNRVVRTNTFGNGISYGFNSFSGIKNFYSNS